jgi:hypothetical protein
MKTIVGVTLIYQAKAQDWALSIALEDGATRRFPIAAGEQAGTVIKAFEGSSQASFDEASGEIVFTYDPLKLDDLFGLDLEHEDRGPPRSKKHRR